MVDFNTAQKRAVGDIINGCIACTLDVTTVFSEFVDLQEKYRVQQLESLGVSTIKHLMCSDPERYRELMLERVNIPYGVIYGKYFRQKI